MHHGRNHQCAAILIAAVYLGTALTPARAQTSGCSYDPKSPSLKHARQSFQEFDFVCAEREINDVLKRPDLDSGIQAEAHAMLAAVFFQTLPDDQRRRDKVIEEFRRTFSLRPDWKGQLEIQTPAFRDLMTEAKRQVEQLSQKPKPTTPPTMTAARKPESKGSSKKTWIYAAVGAAAVGVAIIALGGGGGKSGGDGSLPDFPPPPSGAKR